LRSLIKSERKCGALLRGFLWRWGGKKEDPNAFLVPFSPGGLKAHNAYLQTSEWKNIRQRVLSIAGWCLSAMYATTRLRRLVK
jgi:hypothetical protein